MLVGCNLSACDIALDPAQAAVLKKNLAQIILAFACNGERSIDRLRGVALKALTYVSLGVSRSRTGIASNGRAAGDRQRLALGS
jgi:hypothetical protein